MTRPTATTQVPYQYAFSTDTVSLGYLGGGTDVPLAWSNANWNHCRWHWDTLGTFASAPIFTAYPNPPTNIVVVVGDGSLLGGSADTGNRSYMKGNLWGQVTSAGTPTSSPTNAPVVTDGTTGPVTPTAGAHWATHYQDLQTDNDYLRAAAIPASLADDSIQLMVTLFAGPAETTALYLYGLTTKYTFL